MGKRRGRRRYSSRTPPASKKKSKLPGTLLANNHASEVKGNEGETTLPSLKVDGKSVKGANDTVVNANADDCCFANETSACQKSDVMKTVLPVSESEEHPNDFCVPALLKLSNCYPPKQPGTVNGAYEYQEAFKKSMPYFSINQRLNEPSCCSSKDACALKENASLRGCCSNELNCEFIDDNDKYVQNDIKVLKDCSNKATTSRLGDFCISAKQPKNTTNSGCSSSNALLPGRSLSFSQRVVEFRSDRGASLVKQRPQVGSNGKHRTATEFLEILRLNIRGMTCSGCCTRIEKFLMTQRGVMDVNVSLLTSRGIFQYDPQVVTAKQIIKVVATLGFESSVLSSDELVSVVLHFGPSTSSLQAKNVALGTNGVVAAEEIDNGANSSSSILKALLVEYNPDVTGARSIVRQLSHELGVDIQASSSQAPSVRAGVKEVRRARKLLLWSCFLSLPVLFIEFILPVLYPSLVSNPANVGLWGTSNCLSIKNAVEMACATPMLFFVARHIHESASYALRYGGRVTMDVLISLSACTAYAFSVVTVVSNAFATFRSEKAERTKVGDAQASRGVRQSIADAVAAYFTTCIIILAGAMFLLWYFLAKNGQVETQGWRPFPFALRFAITVLVISCPCAISLAVPTAVMVATTKGSQMGILFKGGRALEALEEVNAVVFDKTGTLTTAQLEVANAYTTPDSMKPTQLWGYVAAAEKNSEHSIGKALVAHAQIQEAQIEEAQEFEAVPGCGVHCTVRGIDVRLGSLPWLKQQTYGDRRALRVPAEFVEANQQFQSQGSIVVFVVIDGELVSAIALHDTLRPEAKRVIEQLKREKIQPWILTGDQRGTAMSVAKALGVPEGSVLAECLPHQKVDKVRLLQSLGLRVAFVGDGVNDAPALATSDIGVALGAGTDVALDAADVVLVKDDLRDLLNARALSSATNRRIKHNFAWGFMYNLLMMPIACGALYVPFGIWIPPALAGLSELLSSVPVILFSLLLNFWRPPFGGDWGLQQYYVAIDVTESTPLLQKQL
ncbi:hypothetical protein CCR75_001697 [Bremia lactucae]|uniref:HMA domain-containing protein n=1 Tax=Bremia lactucae TaxID=4779 RepID=A0A976FDB6_BRELC|nr:hypothetical protein CCR75_001697 [Bremia lactucae]